MIAAAVARRRRLAVALVAFVSALAFLTPGALAQEEPAASPVDVVLVDDTGEGTDLYVRTVDPIDEIAVVVNGQSDVPRNVAPLNVTDEEIATALVVDNSDNAGSDESLDTLKAAALAYIGGRDVNETVCIITAGGNAKVRRACTNSIEAASSSIDSMAASGSLVLWDAIDLAADHLLLNGADVNNIVVLTAHADLRSTATAAAARGAVLNANASVWALGYRAAALDDAELARTVELAGGDIAVTDDPSALPELATSAGDQIKNTYIVRFAQGVPTNEGANSISLTINGATTTVGFTPDAITTGGSLAPAAAPASDGGLGFLKSNTGKSLSVLLGAVAAALAVYAFALLFEKDPDGLNAVLQPYSGMSQMPAEERGTGLSRHALFARAFEITENFAERRGFLSRTEAALERADLPLRAAEALTFYAGGVLILGVLSFVWQQNVIITLIVVGIAVMAGPAIVNFAANRRKNKFVSQLPDTLQLLAGTLKAGYSFMQGLEAVSQETEDPMGEELRRVVTETQLGRPVDEALDAAAERMDSPDFAWAVMAVKIQREVGGNLAELLMTVSETMVARERLRREVKALTAEGRISALVLGALPILLGLAMWALNPEYVEILFTETVGNVMLIVSVIAALIGFAWMKKIITIEI